MEEKHRLVAFFFTYLKKEKNKIDFLKLPFYDVPQKHYTNTVAILFKWSLSKYIV